MAEIVVKGLTELNAMLKKVPEKMRTNIMRSALREGSKVMMATAKSRVPVGPPSSEGAKKYGGYAGALRDSIRVTTKLRGGSVESSVRAGGKKKGSKTDVWYAHLIEFTGAKPHRIAAKNEKKKNGLLFGGMFRTGVDHPGMSKKPFMRPALASSRAAVIAIANFIRKRLQTKAGLDLAHIRVEGDDETGFANVTRPPRGGGGGPTRDARGRFLSREARAARSALPRDARGRFLPRGRR